MKYYLINVTEPVELFFVGKSVLDPEWMHYERTIPHYILYVVTSGAFYLEIDGEKKAFFPGDAFLLNSNAHHIGYKKAAVTFYWMHIFSDGITSIDERNLPEHPNSDPASLTLYMPEEFKMLHMENFIILINHLIHSFKETPLICFNRYLATAILLEVQRQATEHSLMSNRKKNRRFAEVIAYIEANYREKLRVSDLAKRFDYNEKYLARLFQTQLDTTVTSFITETRLKIAETWLLNTNEPISVIAAHSGFSNEYYFMRRFRQKYNMSPSQYRNTYYLQVMSKYQ